MTVLTIRIRQGLTTRHASRRHFSGTRADASHPALGGTFKDKFDDIFKE